MIVAIILISIITFIISIRWVKGIEYMDKNHKEYKGEDLFKDDK